MRFDCCCWLKWWSWSALIHPLKNLPKHKVWWVKIHSGWVEKTPRYLPCVRGKFYTVTCNRPWICCNTFGSRAVLWWKASGMGQGVLQGSLMADDASSAASHISTVKPIVPHQTFPAGRGEFHNPVQSPTPQNPWFIPGIVLVSQHIWYSKYDSTSPWLPEASTDPR